MNQSEKTEFMIILEKIMSQTKVMVVEDERIIAEDIRRSLLNLGYEVSSIVSSGNKAIEDAEKYHPDIILMDIVLKGEMDGIEAAGHIHRRINIPVIYLTAYTDEQIMERAKITEPFGYIIKPFNERELHINIEIALYKYKMEKKLMESERLLSATIKSLGEAVIATDTEGNITIMNPSAECLTCWKQEDSMGKPLMTVFNIICEDTGRQVENPVSQIIREGIFYGFDVNTVLKTKEGSVLPVDIIGTPIKDNNNNIVGIVIVFDDITQRRQMAQMLRENSGH
ncbi:MAG: putative transcriptional regulator [Candidatus Methanoperedens nitroreducens]|uniref:Putative transcriptional regulator n=1 Tax=Candidatus Methanoperedens nitratireducens TaxID=1392998 RepID=A0A0P8AB81_9EURY|nr:MAG: putative transcriptional regulator [Candidatus Methanoperedens sp. BLZ1]